MLTVDNAVIMAAGTSSRFAPLSYEFHKALIEVKGEILIERQIKQLKSAGITEVYVVTGYKAEQFDYLKKKFGVNLIYNSDYLTRNNNSSIWAARDIISNTYICSADNYFSENPFEKSVENSYYSAEYANGYTNEWCMTEDDKGYINSVTIGGSDSWYMLGHVFWSKSFSEAFLNILKDEYYLPKTVDKLWEKIFVDHLDKLKMRIRKYKPNLIYEFDTLDELREFDTSYVDNTRSIILKSISKELCVEERDLVHFKTQKGVSTEAIGFEFECKGNHYCYNYKSRELKEIKNG